MNMQISKGITCAIAAPVCKSRETTQRVIFQIITIIRHSTAVALQGKAGTYQEHSNNREMIDIAHSCVLQHAAMYTRSELLGSLVK